MHTNRVLLKLRCEFPSRWNHVEQKGPKDESQTDLTLHLSDILSRTWGSCVSSPPSQTELLLCQSRFQGCCPQFSFIGLNTRTDFHDLPTCPCQVNPAQPRHCLTSIQVKTSDPEDHSRALAHFKFMLTTDKFLIPSLQYPPTQPTIQLRILFARKHMGSLREQTSIAQHVRR